MKLRLSPSGTVTQATSKTTAVTIDTPGGQITTHAAALAATTSVSFTVNNSYALAGDSIRLNISSGATAASYSVQVDAVALGSFRVHLRNISGGSLAEALVMNFAIVRLNY